MIRRALDGLQGVVSVTFDTETRRFTVAYRSNTVSKAAIVKSVEQAGSFKVQDWKRVK